MRNASVRADVAVIIVDFHAEPHVRAALDSLTSGSCLPAQVVIVDNGLDAVDYTTSSNAFELTHLRPDTNLGFAGGCNLGWRSLPEEISTVVFMNPDTVIAPEGLNVLVAHLDRSPSVCSVGGVMQHSGLGSTGSFAGGVTRYSRWTGRSSQVRVNPEHSTTTVPWLNGALFAIRKRVLDEVDGFDESFFLYREELDMFLRVSKLHPQAHCLVSETVADHVGGVSTGSVASPLRVTFMSRNYLKLARKHSGVFMPLWAANWLLFEPAIILAKKGWRSVFRHFVAAFTVSKTGSEIIDQLLSQSGSAGNR